jgi:hypothetical protein
MVTHESDTEAETDFNEEKSVNFSRYWAESWSTPEKGPKNHNERLISSVRRVSSELECIGKEVE